VTLQEDIEFFFTHELNNENRPKAFEAFSVLKEKLNSGEVRAASPDPSPANVTGWTANSWVKRGILLGFRLGQIQEYSLGEQFRFFDKHTYPLRTITLADKVRIVPGGTSVRDGSFVGKNVVIMPPAYINVGAYVDESTMIDSHALVGSCAQVGKRVHLSAAVQVGGVLEPIGALPVIIEDDVFVGGQCGIYEGTVVARRAVLAPGVILTGSTTLYDVVNNVIHRRSSSAPLIVPEGAVVVPGSRQLSSPFAKEQGLSAYAPVIIKYRDSNTDAATVLESSLR
jgi:2,3,4,5-tetrahydropyridine-2-carboxylate N-succinyltransferase